MPLDKHNPNGSVEKLVPSMQKIWGSRLGQVRLFQKCFVNLYEYLLRNYRDITRGAREMELTESRV